MSQAVGTVYVSSTCFQVYCLFNELVVKLPIYLLSQDFNHSIHKHKTRVNGRISCLAQSIFFIGGTHKLSSAAQPTKSIYLEMRHHLKENKHYTVSC